MAGNWVTILVHTIQSANEVTIKSQGTHFLSLFSPLCFLTMFCITNRLDSYYLFMLYRLTHVFFIFSVDFCQFCVVIRFFFPATTANDLRLWRIFYPRFYPLHLFSYLNSLRKSQYFPFLMLSAKQGYHWYHFYNVFYILLMWVELFLQECPLLGCTLPLSTCIIWHPLIHW